MYSTSSLANPYRAYLYFPVQILQKFVILPLEQPYVAQCIGFALYRASRAHYAPALKPFLACHTALLNITATCPPPSLTTHTGKRLSAKYKEVQIIQLRSCLQGLHSTHMTPTHTHTHTHTHPPHTHPPHPHTVMCMLACEYPHYLTSSSEVSGSLAL